MTTHTIIGYDADALVFDPNTGSFSLNSNYNAQDGRVRLDISDDDQFFDGDRENDEVGEDANQTASIYDMDGNFVSSGQIYVEQYAVLQAPDGSQISIDRIEIGGGKVAYLPSSPLQHNTSYSVVSQNNVDDTNRDPSQDGDDGAGEYDSRLTYDQYNDVPCFTQGLRIETDQGLIAIEDLCVGLRVRTLQNGFQPVRAIISTHVSPSVLALNPDQCPVTFPAVEGYRPLSVSGNHRIVLDGWAVELVMGEDKVLASAKHLQRTDPVAHWSSNGVTYFYIIFDRHEVVRVEGQWSESYFVADEDEVLLGEVWKRMGAGQSPLPFIAPHQSTALVCMREFEALTVLQY